MKHKPVLALQARPQLATHCYFLANARRADVIWTRDDFRTLCHRMLNGNGEHHFMMCYRDAQNKAKYSKAFRARASDRIEWAFDTICGTEKLKTGIGFYPTNQDDESCWGALDFDAHNQEERLGRAYSFAGKAFDLLCHEAPDHLWVIADTSGQSGGWHIFVFSAHFYPTGEWERLLREVADRIGAPIEKGVCEVFPQHTRGLPYGIRAPGSWNPKDDSCGLIAFDGVTPNLRVERCKVQLKRSNASLSASCTSLEEKVRTASSEIYRGEHDEWPSRFRITAPRSRHEKLKALVGTAFFQVSKRVARENARLQYAEADPAPTSLLDEHLADLVDLWAGMEQIWLAKLSEAERVIFDGLTNDNDREAFRIIYNWSQTDSPDFKIVCESLEERLDVGLKTASNIRRRFCTAGILRQTAKYVPHKLAARYEWIANKKPKGKRLFKFEPLSREAGGWQGPTPLRLIGCSHDYRDELPFQTLIDHEIRSLLMKDWETGERENFN